jgi:hypothetical protein
MTYVQKARLTFLGIDDELKNDASSVYSTVINSSFYPIPPLDASGNPTAVFEVDSGGTANKNSPLKFEQRNNTKRLRFSLNGAFNDLNLSPKAKLVIESVTVPNIINMSYRQSKCVGNILLKLHGLNRANSWDSSGKKKSAPTIFTTPVKLNLQGFGNQTDTSNNSIEGVSWVAYGKLNGDNNGNLYINPDPLNLYNFNIGDRLMDIFEFELIYDMAFCRFVMKGQTSADKQVQQQLILTDDIDDLEGFQITFLVMDIEEEDKLYNDKDLLNKINNLIYRK